MDASPVVPGLWAVKIRFVNAYCGDFRPLLRPTELSDLPTILDSSIVVLRKSKIGNTVIETESFIKQAAAIWSAAEIDDLKDHVARNPLAGDEIPGTGGLRKLRWGRAGMGKRGGARVIYYYYNETTSLYLFVAYAKAAQENPSPAAMAILARLAEAAKAGIKAKQKEK